MEDWRVRLKAELNRKRAEEGLLITKLSEALGWSRDRVGRMTNPNSNPGIQDVITMCEKAGISISYVLTGKREDPIYDGVITEMSKLTKSELNSLKNHLSSAPLKPDLDEDPDSN
ncbi:helix-turn-helix transcriptional regulator [Leisingera sp. M527]|uniref:helix-turn-helix domain-containing protein n=1 Tax=Leisingera sp. M527 TaxID=2867014 RepID=UPI0021A86DD9|nr:helix-turn-helix transcriptional regulator [Leisingera sp. M527]UWQ34601.1 helix-turn-helix transcriptional regulator [Leisingera sp. M527]